MSIFLLGARDLALEVERVFLTVAAIVVVGTLALGLRDRGQLQIGACETKIRRKRRHPEYTPSVKKRQEIYIF